LNTGVAVEVKVRLLAATEVKAKADAEKFYENNDF
jgi:hypothetical protein